MVQQMQTEDPIEWKDHLSTKIYKLNGIKEFYQ